MLGLLDQLEMENPEDPALAPKASLHCTIRDAVVLFKTCCGICPVLTMAHVVCRPFVSGQVLTSDMCKSSRSSNRLMTRQCIPRKGKT